MPDTIIEKKVLQGGEFLLRETDPADTFIPEEFDEDAQMIRQMVIDFREKEILPKTPQIEKLEDGVVTGLLKQAAELGLLGPHMPEEYGGMALDTNVNTLISDELGPSGSITVPFAVQKGIGMLPILYFGTEAQKQKYLPKLINAEMVAAYCLTEPGSGSDALAAKTKAELTGDGNHYLINGQKMWISNAGWADLFIVFAKIDGEKFTGFIVEKDKVKGLTLGAEEDKMGIKGSSTRQVFFENVKVPKENVLGEIGKGHLIAFNALNIGRFKLGAMCIGGAKYSTDQSVKYANEREQFGRSIASFGAIKHKIAEQAIRTYAAEASLYRVSQLMQTYKEYAREQGATYAEAMLKAAEEYAIECAFLKVLGSEVADFVVDETVQIYGGLGFSEEYRPARAYRDNRINRIYEGTNEINRLLIVDMLLKRSMKGRIDMVGPAWDVQKELASMPNFETVEGTYGQEKKQLKDFKKTVLMVAGAAAKKQMDGELNLKEEQEVLMNVADMLIETFMAESLLLRIAKLNNGYNKVDSDVYHAMLQTFFYDANARIRKWASDALVSFAEGDLQKTLLMGLKRFSKYPPCNVKANRRKIAAALIESNGWCF